MASGRLTPSDIDRIFDVFDADNSGNISTEEYRTALLAMGYKKVTQSEAREMMDDRPFVNREEFGELVSKHAEAPNSMSEAHRAFNMFDPKKTGRLNQDLLLKAGLAATGSTPSLDLVKRILEACDQDGDGVMDFDEFCAAVTLKLRLIPDPTPEELNPSSGGEKREGDDENKNSDDDDNDANANANVAGASSSDTQKQQNLPPGYSAKKIMRFEACFNENNLIDSKYAREHLTLLGYPVDVLSDDALDELFQEQDKDKDGLLDEAQYKELLTALGEFE